jgi:uncharacterized protein YndB with AHSA1/START domain
MLPSGVPLSGGPANAAADEGSIDRARFASTLIRSSCNNNQLADQVKTTDSTVKILAPASKVWRALTMPGLVRQWLYGADLLTTWEPGTPIVFRNEWNGEIFEQKGTVLEFIPESRLKYSLFFPHDGLQDIPEHYFFMTYELTESGGLTSLLFRKEDPRPSPPDASSDGDDGSDVLSHLKELVEVKMP